MRMEVFEEKPRVDRQASSASARIRRNSKVGYILTMAGIILLTSALLVIIHFTKEYTNLSAEISELNPESAEKLERRTCDVPFCNTKECVYIAATMLESMNLNADPCSDFYEYSCGGYSRAKAVPYASDHYSLAKEAQEELLIDIRKTLEKISSDGETAAAKMKRIYNSCMNVTLRDEAENRTLSSWLSDLGIVPSNYVLGNAFDFDHDVSEWSMVVAKLEQYQIHTLFKPHFVATTDSATGRMEVDCLIPSLSPESYLNTTDDELAFQLVMYKESMNAALELLHMNMSARHQFVEDVMKIETEIARMVTQPGDPSSYPYLTTEYKQQLKDIFKFGGNSPVQNMEVVSVCKYDVQQILTILNNTPNRDVIKYVMWKMLMQMMQYMGTEFRSLHLHYMTKLPGFDYAYESKWRECVDVVRSELGLVATKSLFDHGYLQLELIEALKAEFVEMKRDIALIFSSLIQGVDASFTQKFSDKLKSMRLDTGYLDQIFIDGFLDDLYSSERGIGDIGDEYFSNILALKKFKARRNALLNHWSDNDDRFGQISLEHSPLDSTSSYDYIKNRVRIDVGLLRPPVFMHSSEIPKFLNYGFSSVIAREMSKAFDTTGSFYDAEGQRFEKLWWPSAIEQKYDDFLLCLKHQLIGLNIAEANDTRTINNIMADMGSFFIPYEGLKTHLQSNMDEKPLPGVPLNKKQTFYVQTAQMFCELRSKPASDPESKFLLPPKSRANIAISNMEDFGSIFNCPSTSAMNLENKCNLFSLLPDED